MFLTPKSTLYCILHICWNIISRCIVFAVWSWSKVHIPAWLCWYNLEARAVICVCGSVRVCNLLVNVISQEWKLELISYVFAYGFCFAQNFSRFWWRSKFNWDQQRWKCQILNTGHDTSRVDAWIDFIQYISIGEAHWMQHVFIFSSVSKTNRCLTSLWIY